MNIPIRDESKTFKGLFWEKTSELPQKYIAEWKEECAHPEFQSNTCLSCGRHMTFRQLWEELYSQSKSKSEATDTF